MCTKIFIFLILFISFFYSCEDDISKTDISDKIVLEGYLYQDVPVTGIHLSQTLPFNSEDTVFPAIADAEVTLEWNGIQYQLEPSEEQGYYEYVFNDLQIIESNTYSIAIKYNNQIITAITTVPEKPANLALSDTVIYISENFTPMGMGSFNDTNEITMTWDNPDNDYFYVVVENIDPDPEDIELGFSPTGGGRFNFRFLSQPFQTDTYVLRTFMSIQQYGLHQVKVYRVNQEYVDLYERREQDSRNLTEPLTNVKNGLGIFTAFSYAIDTFIVKKE
ncbi:MAG: DUF4249 family protein [Bacteroidales bacterium]|nr:DUF4249 family protein [Bacteroidales bacterium]